MICSLGLLKFENFGDYDSIQLAEFLRYFYRMLLLWKRLRIVRPTYLEV